MSIEHCPFCGGERYSQSLRAGTQLLRCRACHAIAWDPQPDDEALQDAYRVVYYPEDGTSERYDRDWLHGGCNMEPALAEQMLIQLTTLVGPSNRKRLLDFGCGTGGFALSAARQGFLAIGLDPDDMARARAENQGLTVFPTLEAMEEAEQKFDVVTLIEVIEHLRDPIGTLRQIREHLQGDGVVLCTTANAHSLASLLLRRRWHELWNPTHMFLFTARALREVFRQAGFRGSREFRWPLAYPHHGPLRRYAQSALRMAGLHGYVVVAGWS